MRFYLKKRTLRSALDAIAKTKDPEMLKIFREVMLYRCPQTRKDRRYRRAIEKVEKMLLMPRVLELGLFNLLCTACALILLPDIIRCTHMGDTGLVIFGLLCLFAAGEIHRILRAMKYVDSFYPYLLVDELISRKIIQLVPKKAALQPQKNPKAKVIE